MNPTRLILSSALAALLSWTPAFAATTTTVIVQTDGEPAAVWMARQQQAGLEVSETELESRRDALAAGHDLVLERIAAAGIDFSLKTVSIPGPGGVPAAEVPYRYTLVFNGFAGVVPVSEVHRIDDVEGVARIHRPELVLTALENSVPFVRSPDLYGGIAELGPFDDVREGFEGQGLHVSVIDTGIEWQHEMFGGDATPPRLGVLPSSALVPENEKVVYHLPFGDLAVEDGFGHGTHVASTAAGYLGFSAGPDGLPLTADDVGLHGTAPQARLHSYTVCSSVLSTVGALGGPIGGCLGESILLAIEDSVSRRTLTGFAKPAAHVINMSLGSPNGSPDSANAIAASNAVLAGAIVVAAAGNSGDVAGIVGSPSVGRHVISVAASTDPGAAAAWYVDVLADGERQDIRVSPMAGTPAPAPGGVTGELVYVDGATTAAQWPASSAGRIAVVREGGAVLFGETANNGAIAGAAAVLMISETENATAVVGTIPAATISEADAADLIALIGSAPQSGDVSDVEVRLEASAGAFRAEVADFSSRGPVTGFGQIKPDLSAPGVDILAAVPPASVLGALGATSGGVNYGSVSGTSMASPHVAGIAAQVKQANPTWTPDMVRTALINTATPMRDGQGAPDSYGTHNPNVHSQGGGLVDAFAAANARALMGVVGDGIEAPGILGSHSFGNVPALETLCTSTTDVEVVLRDVRGDGGTYSVRVENNRGLEVPGVQGVVSASTITVPAGGHAFFRAGLELDSDAFVGSPLEEFQWYVVADRSDGAESLSMPMYFRAVPSVPGIGGGVAVETRTFDGVIGPGASEAAGVLGTEETTLDVPVEVEAGGLRLVGHLEADAVTNAAYPDLDMILLGPDGTQLGSSGNLGSVEHIDAAIAGAGTYVFRIENYLGVDSSFTLTVDVHSSGSAESATLQAIQGETTDLSGASVDFDGDFVLHFAPSGQETALFVERSLDGGPWIEIAEVAPTATSFAVQDAPEGEHAYRMVSHFPGAICTYVADPGNVENVTVDRRSEVVLGDGQISGSILSASLEDGVFEVDLVLTNESSTTWWNPVALEIVRIDGPDSIRVLNADDGGDGQSSIATFDYRTLIGGETWEPGETTGARTLRFANPEGRLFGLQIQARVHRAD